MMICIVSLIASHFNDAFHDCSLCAQYLVIGITQKVQFNISGNQFLLTISVTNTSTELSFIGNEQASQWKTSILTGFLINRDNYTINSVIIHGTRIIISGITNIISDISIII